MRRAAILVTALALATAPVVLYADQMWTATSDRDLSEMRGGFALPGGLLVSFGIVRTIAVDGQVVARTALNVPDVANITADQALQLQAATRLTIVQTGAGNSVQVSQAGNTPGIVIQNTESNRHLQALTEITATANTLRALQALNLNQVLGDALRGALGR